MHVTAIPLCHNRVAKERSTNALETRSLESLYGVIMLDILRGDMIIFLSYHFSLQCYGLKNVVTEI